MDVVQRVLASRDYEGERSDAITDLEDGDHAARDRQLLCVSAVRRESGEYELSRSKALIPILAGLIGLINSFRMMRLPDPKGKQAEAILTKRQFPNIRWETQWRVLGSNQRRLSRRFYRPLPLTTRATRRERHRRGR
jgi:hypothetical protein